MLLRHGVRVTIFFFGLPPDAVEDWRAAVLLSLREHGVALPSDALRVQCLWALLREEYGPRWCVTGSISDAQ